MFWSEDTQSDEFQVPDNVLDLSFKINCKQIKLDHAWPLTDAICKCIPWFKDEATAAIHHIYIPESGNGWSRTDNFADEVIQLSRRTRLKIRIPQHRLDNIRDLSGQTLLIDNIPLVIGTFEQFPLSALTTIVSRHVYFSNVNNEDEFLQAAQSEINALGIQVRKMLCGKSHQLNTNLGSIETKSLMIADISPEESILLQEHGIGEHYTYGCGIFIPQKGITAVNVSD